MKQFIRLFPANIIRSFSGNKTLWHLSAILITYGLVVFGFDWWYFEWSRPYMSWLFPSVILGFLVPVLVPVVLFIQGSMQNYSAARTAAYAVGQAELLALLISLTYKAFTGRAHPLLYTDVFTDISREFHFEFLHRGMFWGWPSSHTAIAFAMAAVVWVLFPKKSFIRFLAVLYAFYIGIGVSVTIHWFSDFVAGAIIGSVIGVAVAKSFQTREYT